MNYGRKEEWKTKMKEKTIRLIESNILKKTLMFAIIFSASFSTSTLQAGNNEKKWVSFEREVVYQEKYIELNQIDKKLKTDYMQLRKEKDYSELKIKIGCFWIR